MSWELVPDAPRPGGPARPRAPRWALTLVGSLVALLGVALLVWPFFAASSILALLVGAALIGNGVAAIVGSRARGIGVPTGILLIVLGALAVLLPELTVRLLVSFVAVMMLIVGIIWLLIALSLRQAIGWVFVALPALVVALGVAALLWPNVALTLAALATGAVTLLIGGSLVWASLALRSPRG